MSSTYLLPENDSLIMRPSGDYAKDKLRILNGYVSRFTTSMKNKQWGALYYIDLEAGPGKNIFEPSKDVMLGSPLIALTSRFPFTHYRFVEKGNEEFSALQQRISASERKENVIAFHGDCNKVVDRIVDEIREKGSTLNLAFLDPEGLELEWQTVEKLGRVGKMDLIINFSTSGFTRTADQYVDKLDRFFGASDWQKHYNEVADKDIAQVRRTMLDYYKQRLATLGYKIHPEEKVFKNSKGAQLYTLMFASKHDLGNKFWSGAIQEVSQPRLF